MGAPLRRVLRVAPPRKRALVLAVAAGAGAAACAIGLMGTSGFLLSRAALHPPVLHLMVAIVAVRAFGLGRAVLRYGERLATHDAALRLLGRLRVSFFTRLEPLAPAGLGCHRRGDLLARVVGDVESLQLLLIRGMVPALVAAAVVLPAVAVAWAFVPAAGAVLAAGLVLAGVVLPVGSFASARHAGTRQARMRGERAAGVVELLEGAPELLAAGAVDCHLDRVRAADRTLARLARRDGHAIASLTGAEMLIAGVTMWGALVVAVPAVRSGALNGVLVATVVLLVMATFEVVTPLATSARQMHDVRDAATRVFAVTDAEPPVAEPRAPRALADRPRLVALRAASVRYQPDGPLALDGVDILLWPGRRVAVVGPSGAGKTTIARALLRFCELDRGRYAIDGIDVCQLAQEDIRRVVTLAEQDAHLFDTSVAENIRLAKPGATDDEVAAALAAAGLRDLGLGVRVGERGRQVSGGQRRRLTLARVLLAGTPYVVLDEPLANLDPQGADAMLDDALAATADRGVLLITHRLAGLRSFDEIVVLDAGRVVERGTHDELLAADGLYGRLWELEQDVERLREGGSRQPSSPRVVPKPVVPTLRAALGRCAGAEC